ncbi:MAG TPA: orotate phosphoribosyltransferase [Methylomirabilota bacterium]|jgi:orotate phosphoribosyltransferase|nr:orotate phosphoribosyltransferase [Methylomirabilota bacterium]
MDAARQNLALFEGVGAIRRGHFELSSGLHSGTYVQCALVLQYPRYAERLGAALAALFPDIQAEAVVSPALGGLIIGQEVARALPAPPGVPGGCPALFTERGSSGILALRRGFALRPGQRILVIEDVWTTGGSTQETIHVVEEAGGCVIAAGALVDRSGGRVEFPVPSEALIDLPMESYVPGECPLCLGGGSPEKPGSRFAPAAR